MDNPVYKLLLVCEAAEAFIALGKKLGPENDLLPSIFLCLISAEDILDRGRTIVASEEPRPDDYKQTFDEAVRRMDAVRRDMGELMDTFDDETIVSLSKHRERKALSEWIRRKDA